MALVFYMYDGKYDNKNGYCTHTVHNKASPSNDSLLHDDELTESVYRLRARDVDALRSERHVQSIS